MHIIGKDKQNSRRADGNEVDLIRRFAVEVSNNLIIGGVPVGIHRSARVMKSHRFFFDLRLFGGEMLFYVQASINDQGEVSIWHDDFRFYIYPGINIDEKAACSFNDRVIQKLKSIVKFNGD